MTFSPDEGSRYLYSDHAGSRQVTGKSHPLDPREDRLPRLDAPVLRAERRSPGSQTPRAPRGLSRAGTEANATTVRSRPAPRSAGAARRPHELGAQGWRAAKEKPRACGQCRPIGPFASPGGTPIVAPPTAAGPGLRTVRPLIPNGCALRTAEARHRFGRSSRGYAGSKPWRSTAAPGRHPARLAVSGASRSAPAAGVYTLVRPSSHSMR